MKLIEQYQKTFSDLAVTQTKEGHIESAKLALSEANAFKKMALDPVFAMDVRESVIGFAESESENFEGGRAGGERENSIGMVFCWVRSGSFSMGRNPSLVTVDLSQGYWVSKFEVTQGQYHEVMGSNPSQSETKGDRFPVVNVTWKDALEFCEKLSEKERSEGSLPKDWAYTLPTEAQWEYAAIADTSTADMSKAHDDRVWDSKNSGGVAHPVGEKDPNDWGIHDIQGNVREWCLDWYGEYRAGSFTDPKGPDQGTKRVTRGGSFQNPKGGCAPRARHSFNPGSGRREIGFRPVIVSHASE